MLNVLRALVVSIVATLGILPASAAAQHPGDSWTVPANALGNEGDQHIDYPAWSSETKHRPGMTTGAVGDVNGDGLEDIATGFSAYPETPVYITFSHRLGGVGNAVDGGFRIDTTWFGWGLSSAGDVNGDGLGDIALVRNDEVVVVFGKLDDAPVDTNNLGQRGFRITEAGMSSGGGGGGVYRNTRPIVLDDLNGDGARELLLPAGGNAIVLYPPRNAAGMRIDARVPGPYVSRIEATGDHALDRVHIDKLGDVDGDGRQDVMVAGEEREGIDSVAYGLSVPAPGQVVDLPTLVAAGRAFELRTSDGRAGWYGELESALTLGDQNGDGRREVGMVGGVNGIRKLRVAFAPSFGTRDHIGDLGASSARGYSFNAYSDVIDVGDQNGDGRGDFATSNYVYFANPAAETGSREAVHRGFYFSGWNGWDTVALAIRDLNGDGRPELGVAHVAEEPGSEGRKATYSIDVFDSARAPEVPPPLPPVEVPDGIEFPVDVETGAGSRGGRSLGLRPRLEIAEASGGSVGVREGSVVPSGGTVARISLNAPHDRVGLVPGRTYRARYVVVNGRGQAGVGAWRTFVFRGGETGGTNGNAPGAKRPRDRGVRVGVWLLQRGTPRGNRLIGTSGRDKLLGFGGNDLLDGRGASDWLDGGSGRDLLIGGTGNERMIGGSGNDRLKGGKGVDRYLGGAGNDTIWAVDGRRETVICGKGRDVVTVDRRDRVRGCEKVKRAKKR